MEPIQTIKDTLGKICTKGYMGKRAINTIEENIKLLTKLNKKQKKIITDIQEQLKECQMKKSEVEKLTQTLKEFNENFEISDEPKVVIIEPQKITDIVTISNEMEKKQIIKKIDVDAGYIFSEKTPMNGISYEEKYARYGTLINSKKTHSKELKVLCEMKKQEIMQHFGNGISEIAQTYKTVSNYQSKNIIICWTLLNNEPTPLFDIMHILKLINVSDRQMRNIRKQLEGTPMYCHFEKNEFGGYLYRELIDEKTMYKIVLDSRSEFSKSFKDDIGQLLIDLRKSGKLQLANIPAVPQIVLPQANLLMPPQPVVNQRRKTIQREILGYDTMDILPRLEVCVTEISCIYLFVVGKVDKLRQEMNIDPKFDDNMYVIKYGLTNDLARRTNEHMRKFNELQESELKLKYYVPMLEIYLPEAEIEIETYFDTLNSRIKWKDMVELAVMTVPMIEALKIQYINLGKTRGGTLVEITQRYETKQKDLQHEKEMFEVKELMYKEQISNLTQRNKILEEIHEKDQGKLVDDILHKIKTIKKWFNETYKTSDNINTESISIKTLYREFITKNQIELTEHEFKTIMKKDTELSNNMKFDAVKKSTRLVGFIKK
jgi:hypothetical protein